MFAVNSFFIVLTVLNQVYGGPVSSESQAMVLFKESIYLLSLLLFQ